MSIDDIYRCCLFWTGEAIALNGVDHFTRTKVGKMVTKFNRIHDERVADLRRRALIILDEDDDI